MTLTKIPTGEKLPINEGVKLINAAIEAADKASIDSSTAKTTAEQALANSEQTQTELTQAILDGDSSPLGGQLSVGADGIVHQGPQERLIAEHNQVTEKLAQKEQEINDLQINKANQTDLSITNQNVASLQVNKADKTKLDSLDYKVSNMGDGSPKGTFSTLTALQNAYPSGTSGIYIVSADGKWYFWSGSAWTAGGVYQSTGLANGIVTRNNMYNSFMGEPIFLDNTVDLNTFTKEGNYYVTNALNKPPQIGVNSAMLMIRHFYTTAGYAQWCIQTAYNVSNPRLAYYRKITLTGTPSNTEWYELTSGTSNRFTDKSVVSFGDSITGSYVAPDDYPTRLKEYLGMKPYNVGFGGARMAQHSLVGYDAFSMYRLVDEIIKPNSDATKWALQEQYVDTHTTFRAQLDRLKAIDFNTINYITIWYGTNDYGAGVLLDNEADPYDITTYSGATRYSLEKLMTTFPRLKVLLISPMFRVRGDSNSDLTPNDGGFYVEDYVNKLIEVGREYKVPVLDMLHESGINRFNYTAHLYDGIHPNLDGRFMLGGKIAGKLSSVY